MSRARNRVAVLAAILVALLGLGLASGVRPSPEPGASPAAAASDVAATALPVGNSPSAASSPAPASAVPIPSPSPSPVLISAPPSIAAGLRPGTIDKTSLNLRATYATTLRVNWSTRSFRASTVIRVTNTSGGAIDRLELNTVAARVGGMTVTGASVNGRGVRPTVSDQTIRLPLGGILDPGAAVSVRVDYRATLRSVTGGSSWLFTKANGVLQAHRWIPWISRATPFERPNHGDPFVTPVSPSVKVTVIADRPIRWATTGEQTDATGTTTTFEAADVRDFALVGAPDYRTASGSVNGVTVRVWYRPGFPATTVLAAAMTSLRREARLLGPYPYPSYDIAQTAAGYGMEAPGLTWIPTGAGSLSYLVAHETAHQWFYGIVGNDQARNPYADEAAADMVARHITGTRRASRCATARLDLTIYAYSSNCYYEVIYVQGGNVLDDLRARIGDTAYWTALRDYIAVNRWKLSSTKRLLDAIDAASTLDLRPTYHLRFPSLY